MTDYEQFEDYRDFLAVISLMIKLVNTDTSHMGVFDVGYYEAVGIDGECVFYGYDRFKRIYRKSATSASWYHVYSSRGDYLRMEEYGL